jgi:hypothetical protein
MVGPYLLPQSGIAAQFKMFKANVVLADTCPISAIIPVTTTDVAKDEDIPILNG